MSRYHVSSSEGQYEKDSVEQVLANKLGIAVSDDMDEAELVLLEQLYQSILNNGSATCEESETSTSY